MKYRIKNITTRVNDYNPIKHLLWHAVKLEIKMRRKYKVYNNVIHENPRSSKPYIQGFAIDIISYDNISFNSHASRKMIKEAIEALEGCELRIEAVYDYIDYYNNVICGDMDEDPEEPNVMHFMIYFPFLINREYISPALLLQYKEKIRNYIETHTKAQVLFVC